MAHAPERAPVKPAVLILWDIDGTLLHCGDAGRVAILEAMRIGFKVEASLDGIAFGGRTDTWIARQLFARHGIEADAANLSHFLSTYTRCLPQALEEHRVAVYPGVREILEELDRDPRFAQVILTGNVKAGAASKLESAGIASLFPTGAWGCDSEDRNDLGPIALERASSWWQTRFDPESACVLGDTPHDIACARALGAACVAVAQGGWSADQLAGHSPDLLLETFCDHSPLLRLLGNLADRATQTRA